MDELGSNPGYLLCGRITAMLAGRTDLKRLLYLLPGGPTAVSVR